MNILDRLGININKEAVIMAFIDKRGRRSVTDLFASIKDEDIVWMIVEEKNIEDLQPPEVMNALKFNMTMFGEASPIYSDDAILSWVPDAIKTLVSDLPNGQEWLRKQVPFLRLLFFGAR